MDKKNGARKTSEMRDQLPTGQDTPPHPTVQPQIQDHIGRQLRAIYEDLLSQPVPDRFAELLEKLDRKPQDDT
jgi:hypothetical protein